MPTFTIMNGTRFVRGMLIRKIAPITEPTAEAPIKTPSRSAPSPSTSRTYNGIITVIIGKINTVVAAISPIIARLGLSFATYRKPSLIPLARFCSSSTVPRGRGGIINKAMISATNETALAKKAEAAPHTLMRIPAKAGPTTRDA